jgi:hypothetical protein
MSQLLDHCRVHERTETTQLAIKREAFDNQAADLSERELDRWKKALSRREASLAKWISWADGLEELLTAKPAKEGSK